MDGMPAASLPAPMPSAPPAPPGVSFMPPGAPPVVAPQGPRTAAPVGRPNSDPEVQQQREEKAGTRKRLGAALPREMTEPRIVVFRLKGRSGMVKVTNRPALNILLSDLEKAINDGAEAGDYIRSQISEKFPESTDRFLWEAHDHKGQKMNEYGQFEINMGDDSVLDEEDDLEEEIPQRLDPSLNQDPWSAPRPPGSPPPLHEQIDSVRHVLNDQHRRETNGNNNFIQMMLAQQEDRRREDAARAEREERRREEDRRRDEDRRREDEARRREENEKKEKEDQRRFEREKEERRFEADRQMQMMKWMMDSSNKPDTMLPMLMKMLDSKSDRDGTKELFGMFNEASKQSMLMQGEASKHMMGAQAEASKMLISNILGISKQMVEAQMEASTAGPDEDPMDKIGRMFKIFGPAIAAIGGGATAQQQVVQTQQRITAAPPAVQPQQQAQRGPATRKTHPHIPDNEWIKGALDTIMQLEQGRLPVEHRIAALKWCADNLPEKMLAPIRAGDETMVLTVGAEGADEKFQGWLFADEKHAEFLRDCVADIQRMLAGAFTEISARESVQRHVAYQQAKQQAAGQPFPQQAAPEAPEAPPAAPVASEEKKAGKRAPPPIATAVAETPTTPGQPPVQNAAPGNI